MAEGKTVTGSEQAERLFMRGGNIWLLMKSGREIKLGPIDQVDSSMRKFLRELDEIQPPPRNRVS